MKAFKLAKGIPLKTQMTYGGALAILVSIAASGFNTLVYWKLLPEALQTMREINFSVQNFYQNGLILNGVLALAGLFLLLTGLFSVEGREGRE